MKVNLILSLCLLAAGAFSVTAAISFDEQSGTSTSSECSQPREEQDAILREAEREKYTARRIEFIGHRYTRDALLRRRFNIGLQEGDLFTRRNLIRSLRNVSKLKTIYPVHMKDVELRLNRAEQTVDVTICFKERRRRRTGG